MQQSLGLIFKNTLLTGGGGVRGFFGQHGQLTPFVDGRVRGSNVSTFSGGGPTNVLDSRVYHHGGGSSGHLRFVGIQLSSQFVSGRGIYCGGGLSFSIFAGRGSSNVSDPRVYQHAVSFENYKQSSSTLPQFQHYASLSPLPLRHLNINGKDCAVFCDDNQYRVLCDKLNITFVSETPKKVHCHPIQFIKKAEKYQRVGDYVRSSKNCWKAYAMVVKLLYKNLKINIQSYDTFHELSLFAIDFIGSGPDAVILGSITSMMEEARENKGEATYYDIDEYIEGAEKFVELFVKIDEKRVWNGLAPYLPTQPGPEHAIIFNGVKFEMKKHSDVIFGEWFNFLYEASDPENEE